MEYEFFNYNPFEKHYLRGRLFVWKKRVNIQGTINPFQYDGICML